MDAPVLHTHEDRRALTLSMRLSLLAGIFMLAIKISAYMLTGSAAILSDATESIVHIVAVGFAAYSLRLSYKPPDDTHLYGHAKISFFSAGFEGAIIVIAALYIMYEAVTKWMGGLVLEHLDWGVGLTALAALINGRLGLYLLRMGKKNKSIVLEANGKHVLTDCWTSIGVLVGLGLALTTGWLPWDPICAILVAANILYSGIGLIRQSVSGLMDTADPAVHQQIIEILEQETKDHDIIYHHLRHRHLGDVLWVELHLLFPQDTSIKEAHRAATRIENAIEQRLDTRAYVTSHLESIEDHDEAHAEASH